MVREILCAPQHDPRWPAHRALTAQALPLAALLHGRELLHASSVVHDGGAIAFCAHSGAGKSSLAAHLVAAGCRLLGDDVLALSGGSDGPVAHPATLICNLDAEQYSLLDSAGRDRLGETIGRSDKLHLLVEQSHRDPAPLRRLYLLERGAGGGIESTRIDAPAAEQLLALAFLPHVSTPERLANQLELVSELARTVPVHRLGAALDVPAPELARHLLRELEGEA